MGEAAVKVALACGYVNAGTVEMLYQDGEFFFLEMNTRLQVEHCVTEEVTGLDLVAEQLRVASGEKLSFTPGLDRAARPLDRVPHQRREPDEELPAVAGHDHAAARARRVPGVRWDGGYEEGDTISQYYDNLIGKLVVWAPDRDRAIDRMVRALARVRDRGRQDDDPRAPRAVARPTTSAPSTTRRSGSKTKSTSRTFAAHARGRAALPPRRRPTARPRRSSSDRARRGRRPAFREGLAARRAGRGTARRGGAAAAGRSPRSPAAAAVPASGTVTAPMQGTIVKVLVEVGADRRRSARRWSCSRR